MTIRALSFVFIMVPLAVSVQLSFGCFNPPAADVQFSCDLEKAPDCPKGYTCKVDGCCHRDGSDSLANLYACKGGNFMESTSLPMTSTTTLPTLTDSTSSSSESSSTDTTTLSTGSSTNNTSSTDATETP